MCASFELPDLQTDVFTSVSWVLNIYNNIRMDENAIAIRRYLGAIVNPFSG
jgi:hypothetical protein